MSEQQPEAWIIVNKETGYRTQVSDLTPFLYHREIFEVIPLYTAPPTHLISAAPELLEALSNWINALDDPSEWMKCRDDAKKAIEKAHGITGVDDE